MSLFIAWILFPVLLGLLCLGAGMLVVRAAGIAVPGALVLPLGLALIVVVTQLATVSDATAELATPLAVVVAVAGVIVSTSRLRTLRPDWWALAAAAGVFGVFAAPVALSGQATFAGYTLLGDTSIHFALIDRVMEHGRTVSGLPASTYRSALEGYFDTAYPLGAHTALGAVRPLVGQDVAWVFQPYLAFLAAMTSLCLYAIARTLVASRVLGAIAAFVAAQPALVLAYALQGAVKEIAGIWVLALLAALVPLAVAEAGGVRRLFPLAVASAAAIGVLSLAVAPWLGPLLLVTLAAVALHRGRRTWRPTLEEAGAFAAVTAVLSIPTLVISGTFVRTTKAVVTAPNEFGNLLGPLNRLQMFGIWPSGDFRISPAGGDLDLTHVLIGIAVAAAVVGTLWAIRMRAGAVLLYLAVSVIGWAYATRKGSPWVDAKALTIVSPAVVFAAMLGPAALVSSGRSLFALAGVAVGAAVAAGVLWSNALAYHDADLAPRQRLAELQRTGDRIAGRGPTLYTEFEEFAKHFLRGGDPTGWSEAWTPLANRGRFGFSADIDEVPIHDVLRFRTLVLRRSPSASRPPSVYRRTFAGRYYEVWQRPNDDGIVAAHLPLGGVVEAGGRSSCRGLDRIARLAARNRDHLASVKRERPTVLVPAKAGSLPTGWGVDRQDTLTLRTPGPGRIAGSIRTQAAGEYEVWLQGSFGRAVSVTVDGRKVGAVRNQLNGRGQYGYVGETSLPKGMHAVVLVRGGGNLRPGNGGRNRLLGPVVFSPKPDGARIVTYSRPRAASRLCAKRLDWIEAVSHLP